MSKQSEFSQTPSAYSWFISALDTANPADHANTGVKPSKQRTDSHGQRLSLTHWMACFSWLPLWRLDEPNTP